MMNRALLRSIPKVNRSLFCTNQSIVPLDMNAVRGQFPAILNNPDIVFADAPGGTQCTQRAIDKVTAYMSSPQANLGGCHQGALNTIGVTKEGREALADFLNCSPSEVTFGQNMTSLTMHLSRSIAVDLLSANDEIILTTLENDANVTPWENIAREVGATVRRVPLFKLDIPAEPVYTLNFSFFKSLVSMRTKLLCIGLAANSCGTVNAVAEMTSYAKSINPNCLVFCDATHYSPHGKIDVQELGVDFLACSAYKFFGPHIGILFGRQDIMESLKASKIRSASNELPGINNFFDSKWEAGCQNFEHIAGATGAIDYIASLSGIDRSQATQKSRLNMAWKAIQLHETALIDRFLDGVRSMREGIFLHGIPTSVNRTPTFCLMPTEKSVVDVTQSMVDDGIAVAYGNFDSSQLSINNNWEPNGYLRVGFTHYNTLEEVDLTLNALDAAL